MFTPPASEGGLSPNADHLMFTPPRDDLLRGLGEQNGPSHPHSPGEQRPLGEEERTPVETKRARAAHARQVKAELATARRRSDSRQAVWQSAAQGNSAHDALCGLGERNRGSVPRDWHQRMVTISANMGLAMEHESLQNLLEGLKVLKEEHLMEPCFFAWARMYDETPSIFRTHSVQPSGELIADTATAKVMACLSKFVLVFRTAGGTHHVVRGSIGNRLASLVDLSGPVVKESILHNMWIPRGTQQLIEDLFPRRVLIRMTDLHRSSIAAERAISRELARWASSLFRCSLHRVRTAERLVLEALETRTERFFLHTTLSLKRTPGAMRAFRQRAHKWTIDNEVEITQGPPDKSVEAWRESMEALLFPPSPGVAASHADHNRRVQLAVLRRKHAWQHVFNGDGRQQGRLRHHERGCCPKGRPQTECMCRGPGGLGALLHPMPRQWPRKSWQGQAECANHIIQLQATHGLLAACYTPVAVLARQREGMAQRRLASVLEKVGGRLAASQANPNGAVDGEADREVAAASLEQLSAEENARAAQDVQYFFVHA